MRVSYKSHDDGDRLTSGDTGDGDGVGLLLLGTFDVVGAIVLSGRDANRAASSLGALHATRGTSTRRRQKVTNTHTHT